MICIKFDHLLVLENIFCSISTHVNMVFPLVSPSDTTFGTMIWRNLNRDLHYVRKFSCECELFWLSGSREEKFLMSSSNVLHFLNYLPFEEDLTLYFDHFELSLPRDYLYQVWLKLAGWFWRLLFLNINTCEYCSTYRGPSKPLGTMIWINLNLHYVRKLSCEYT
jgi:hypothetical protein